MKREIGFRARRVDSGKWVYGFYCRIQNDDSGYTHIIKEDTTRHIQNVKQTSFEVIPETVGQFTGMYDKNGKEIYEGDIWFDDGIAGEVIFDECKFKIKWGNGSKGDLHTNVTTSLIGKVIGNIYENPELLTA
jgi:hypothetical protein